MKRENKIKLGVGIGSGIVFGLGAGLLIAGPLAGGTVAAVIGGILVGAVAFSTSAIIYAAGLLAINAVKAAAKFVKNTATSTFNAIKFAFNNPLTSAPISAAVLGLGAVAAVGAMVLVATGALAAITAPLWAVGLVAGVVGAAVTGGAIALGIKIGKFLENKFSKSDISPKNENPQFKSDGHPGRGMGKGSENSGLDKLPNVDTTGLDQALADKASGKPDPDPAPAPKPE